MRLHRLAPLLLLTSVVAAAVGEFQIRPVIPLTAPQLATLRELIAGDAEAQALAAAETESAKAWLEAEPQPLAEIHYEGLVIRHVQEFLGHADLDTTKIYLRLVPGDLREDYDDAMPELVAIGHQ